jgi:amino acid permease
MTKLISREELLGGGMAGRVTKQASTLLALIENRTAHAMVESRQAVSRSVPLRDVATTSQAYLAAMAQGRTLPAQPTIYDLEKYAGQWADLVPENPAVRAAVAQAFGQKYRFTRRGAPGVRAALGVETPVVQQAYEASYGQPISAIFAARMRPGEQARWFWTRLAGRLENLSPFWTAFALTLTEIVGAGILALPIALAQIGPLAGIMILVVLGIVNILTLVAITEAITRNGNIRYGTAYFGRLVYEYLGSSGTFLFGASLIGLNVLALIAYYTGIATTLTSVTGLPSAVWPVALFAVTAYTIRRESLDATIASALVIGAVNLGLIFILSLLSLPHVQGELIRYVNLPGIGGRPFTATIFELIFGVVLSAYAGHVSVGNMAKTVLRRDPTGRTLLWGNVAAMVTAMLLYCLWLVAVNGAIPAATLAATAGTALIPLAAVVGPSVHLFGTLFVLLGMGMASIHFSLALFNLVREWLPGAEKSGAEVVKRLSLRHRELQFWICMIPTALICLLTIWLLQTGQQSFSRPLGLLGALAVPLISGLFPMLLLVAGRRKGDYHPDSFWRWLGKPLAVVVLYLLFFASILLHGLVIWQNPVERLVAVVVSVVVAGITVVILRRGSFAPRVVVEVRKEPGKASPVQVAVVDNTLPDAQRGLPTTPVTVHLADGHTQQQLPPAGGDLPKGAEARGFTLHLPATRAQELKVWTHQLTPTGDSVALTGRVTVQHAGGTQSLDLGPGDGQVILPTSGAPCQVEITLES